jgi:hypothetical protein
LANFKIFNALTKASETIHSAFKKALKMPCGFSSTLFFIFRGNTMPLFLLFVLLISSFSQAFANRAVISVDIVDDRGRSFNEYSVGWRGDKYRAYIEAKYNRNYRIRVQNLTNERIGLVIAVDGKNILNGRTSSLSANEPKYVLNPGSSGSYDGWRSSKNRVNRFYFTDAGNAYAAAFGDFGDLGIISIAVFFEDRPYYRDDRKEVAPFSRSRPGTGYGYEEYSPTINTDFYAQSRPHSIYLYRYQWREQLCRRGIVRCSSDNNRPGDVYIFDPSNYPENDYVPPPYDNRYPGPNYDYPYDGYHNDIFDGGRREDRIYRYR